MIQTSLFRKHYIDRDFRGLKYIVQIFSLLHEKKNLIFNFEYSNIGSKRRKEQKSPKAKAGRNG